MLETIREYAGDRLEASGEADVSSQPASRIRAARVGRARTDGSRRSGRASGGSSELDQELENVRAVLAWLERSGQLDTELDLVGRVWNYWALAWNLARRPSLDRSRP